MIGLFVYLILIVDARISVPSTYSTGYFFISEVELIPDRVKLKIAYTEDAVEIYPVSSMSIDVAEHESNTSYAFIGAGSHRSITGSLSIGNIADSLSSARGLLTFSSPNTRFEVSIVYVSQPSVQFLQLLQNGRETAQLTGVVPLIAGGQHQVDQAPHRGDQSRCDLRRGAY